ncbi:MAG: hypothetical protein RQ866_06585 [Bacteroidales bacterium]|nr:hypothetical protein [Bacteroidales bacterium]
MKHTPFSGEAGSKPALERFIREPNAVKCLPAKGREKFSTV